MLTAEDVRELDTKKILFLKEKAEELLPMAMELGFQEDVEMFVNDIKAFEQVLAERNGQCWWFKHYNKKLVVTQDSWMRSRLELPVKVPIESVISFVLYDSGENDHTNCWPIQALKQEVCYEN